MNDRKRNDQENRIRFLPVVAIRENNLQGL
jgi:hypothetical protein